MGKIPFVKMHGLGNDFVVLDGRRGQVEIGAAGVRALAHRRTGIGCDQVILLAVPRHPAAHIMMRIHNADGSEAEACGNATRCVADLMKRKTGEHRVRIETVAGLLEAEVMPDGRVTVDMGPVRTDWHEIPLCRPMDTDRVELALGPLCAPVCTNVGNPHATFFVDNVDEVDLAGLGPLLEHNPLFPERANIGVASVRGRENIRLKVWERGAGITPACGSAACAALAAAHRRGLTGRNAIVELDGGVLDILWRRDQGAHMVMTGPVALSFEGVFDLKLIGGC